MGTEVGALILPSGSLNLLSSSFIETFIWCYCITLGEFFYFFYLLTVTSEPEATC